MKHSFLLPALLAASCLFAVPASLAADRGHHHHKHHGSHHCGDHDHDQHDNDHNHKHS